MSHFSSVFNNSCIKVPLDPLTKMPITEYDRKSKRLQRRTSKIKRRSVDSCSSDYSTTKADTDAKQVRDFFESIPDYKDVDHLTQEEFYATLRALREKKRQMLGYSVSHIDDDNGHIRSPERILVQQPPSEEQLLQTKEHINMVEDSKLKNSVKSRYDKGSIYSAGGLEYSSNIKKITDDIESILTDGNIVPDGLPTKNIKSGPLSDCEIELKRVPARELSPKNVLSIDNPKEPIIRSESRSKRNHSACSISWNDQCTANIPDDVDNRFDKYFSGTHFTRVGKERKSRSMPTSPVKVRRRRSLSPDVYRKNAFTVPKPFKMTLRDEDDRINTGLKSLTKSFSDEMLHRKSERRRFKARPVPIESRIPLYDKIMEDQAMRFQDIVELSKPHAALSFIFVCERAISKINSTAELQAQMKPFSFTEREELRPRHTCDRHDPAIVAEKLPLPDKNKFRARPIPKNLFSNYVFEKMKEDEFYRALSRRIRAEELLRNASLPPSMAARDKSASRSRMSTPGGLLSDLPTDTNSDLSSNKSKRKKAKRPIKSGKRGSTSAPQEPLRDFITTSPEPFHLSTACRARSKEEAKKLYGKRNSSPLAARSTSAGGGRPLSAMEMPSVNRSNLAAVLRIETTKKRLEEEVERQLAAQEHRAELRWRDHVLRKKPAWQLVKNNFEEDIAMRLQTRRDEERLRREEFLHEMELMYGRVRNQPLLFERYYSPSKSSRDILESVAREMEISLKKSQRRKNSKKVSTSAPLRHTIPSDPNVSKIRGGSKENLLQYLNKMEDEEKLFSGAESLSDDNND